MHQKVKNELRALLQKVVSLDVVEEKDYGKYQICIQNPENERTIELIVKYEICNILGANPRRLRKENQLCGGLVEDSLAFFEVMFDFEKLFEKMMTDLKKIRRIDPQSKEEVFDEVFVVRHITPQEMSRIKKLGDVVDYFWTVVQKYDQQINSNLDLVRIA